MRERGELRVVARAPLAATDDSECSEAATLAAIAPATLSATVVPAMYDPRSDFA